MFNPLYPNEHYFNLASFRGCSNLVHLKPLLAASPLSNLKLALAVRLHWRMTTAEAAYVQVAAPVPRTAGRGGGWTGACFQLRAEFEFNPNLAGATETVRFHSSTPRARLGAATRPVSGRS